MWVGDLKFKGLNFSVDVIDASIGGSWFVEKIEEYGDENKSSDEGIKHKCVGSQGKVLSL